MNHVSQPLFLNNLLKACTAISDPRSPLGVRHKLSSIVALMTIATLCGANDNKSIVLWGKANEAICNLLKFRNGKPASESTLCRVCKTLPSNWYDLVMEEYQDTSLKGKQICLDGKRTKGKKNSQQLTVTAIIVETHTVIGVKNTTFGKELNAVRELLDELDLTDCTVTTDALSTQRDVLKKL
jgi:hypothetical protein